MPAAKKAASSTQNLTTTDPQKKQRSVSRKTAEIPVPNLGAQSLNNVSEPISVKPKPKAKVDVSLDWQATSVDWELLGMSRNRRGWQLVALSLGYQPSKGISKRLPEVELKQYKRRLRVLRNSATDKRSTTKLQYERNVLYQRSKSNPDDPIEFSFDVV